ncbi:MAG: protein kinase [Verrucomicrobiales bacterium]
MENPETDRLTFHEVIGEGACGRVYRCTTPEGEVCAVKVLTAMAINRDLVRYSLRKLDELAPHPGIAPVYGYVLSETPYHYVMDLYADPLFGGEAGEVWQSRSLDTVVGTLDHEEAWKLIDQIAEALAYLHANQIFHAGLKPSNIFLANDGGEARVRIGDLGQGWVSGAHYLELNDIPYYASPEQLRTAEFLDGHGQQWDVYSFGVVAYLLLNGRLPRMQEIFNQRSIPSEDWDELDVGEGFKGGERPPQEYATLIEKEAGIEWQVEALDEDEEKRFAILTRCLAVDPEVRFSDMLEVVDAFRRERLASEVGDLEAAKVKVSWSERIALPVRGGRILVTGLGVLLAGALVVAGWQKWKVYTLALELDRARGRIALVEGEKERIIAEGLDAVGRAQARAGTAETREGAAREQLEATQIFGDDLFAFVQAQGGIGGVEFRKGRVEALRAGRDYYRDYIARHGDNPKLVKSIALARERFADIEREIGTRDQRLASLEAFSRSIEGLLAKSPGETSWKIKQAAIYRETSRLHFERSNYAEAESFARKAESIFEALGRGDAEDPTFPFEQARLAMLLGEIQRKLKQPDAAIESLTRSGDLLMPLHDSNPEDPSYRFYLARSFSTLGDILLTVQDTEGALTMHEMASTKFADLVRENSENDEYSHQLAHSLVILGEIRGESQPAQDGLGLLQHLVRKAPENESFQFSLAQCYGILGELQRDAGQAGNAMELQQKTSEILERLIERSPDMADYRYTRALCLSRLADLTEDAGGFEKALSYLTEAYAVMEDLAEGNPENILYQRRLAELRGSIGFANEQVGNKDQARELYASALDQWERLASLLPEDDVVEQGLDWSRRQLAALGR